MHAIAARDWQAPSLVHPSLAHPSLLNPSLLNPRLSRTIKRKRQKVQAV
jgi:hypothetical protein